MILIHKVEICLYKCLGVEVFRAMVFGLEKFIHRKDGKKNINYHIPAYDPLAIDGFVKYLFYNGAIHVRNVFLFSVVFIVKYLVFSNFSVFDFALWLLCLKDLYCIMLQRYNYLGIQLKGLRIKEKYQKKLLRKVDSISINSINELLKPDKEKALAFVKNMLESIDYKNSVVVGTDDIPTLQTLKTLLTVSDANNSNKINKDEDE